MPGEQVRVATAGVLHPSDQHRSPGTPVLTAAIAMEDLAAGGEAAVPRHVERGKPAPL
jgi:hypothetical protein